MFLIISNSILPFQKPAPVSNDPPSIQTTVSAVQSMVF
jgi:hypothetical protein